MDCPHLLEKLKQTKKSSTHNSFFGLPTEDGAQVTLEGLQDDALDFNDRLPQELFAGVTQQFIFCHHLHLMSTWAKIKLS